MIEVLTNLIGVIISQYICVSNHHGQLQLTQCLCQLQLEKKFLSVRNIYTIPKFNRKWTTDLNMNVRIKDIKLLKHWRKFVTLDQAMDS